MSRRAFLKSLTALVGGLALPAPALALPSPSGITSDLPARGPSQMASSFIRGIEGEGAHGRLPETASKTLQESPLAGFQYHHGETPWLHHTARHEPVEGQLVREPDNRYDDRAVRVDWQGYKLGYIPRLDNAAMSQLMDRGERLEAVIVGLENSSNPWDRVKVEVIWRV